MNYRHLSSLAGIVTLTITMLLSSGCAIGNKHNYRDVIATVPSAAGQNVTIATHDIRPYVLSNNKSPSFVGLQRGGYGNPFDVENENSEPLSTSFSAAACASLVASGGQCTPLPTRPFESADSIKTRVSHSGAPTAILFTLHEWKADTMLNTALHYNVSMEVLSSSGATLLTKRISGVDDLRGSFWNAPRYAKRAVPMAFKGKLEQLLGDPEVVASLQPKPSKVAKVAKAESKEAPSSTPSKHSSCSTNQILEMKKLGLSDAQIQKSCE